MCEGQRAFRTNSSCAVFPSYPRVNLPPTCTLSTLSSEPSRGCAMTYDLTHIWGEPLAVDFALQKCAHNPMSFSAVSAKCAGGRTEEPLSCDDPSGCEAAGATPAEGQCLYGHSWCSDAEPCADPLRECLALPLPEFQAHDPEMDDSEDSDALFDPISALMGVELAANPGRIKIEPCLDRYCRPSNTDSTCSGEY